MYFVYKHIRKDNGEVFYIGKGRSISDSEIHHRKYARAYSLRDRNCAWLNIVSEIDYDIEIVFETDNEERALYKEVELINYYGSKSFGGTLVNFHSIEGKIRARVKNELTNKIRRRLNTDKYLNTNTVMKTLEKL